MLFSSPIFLFAFLPLVLALAFAAPRSLRNAVLLVFSIAFYAWGDVSNAGIMLASIAVNHVLARRTQGSSERAEQASARRWVALSVALNLGLLVWLKYWTFLWDVALSVSDGLGVDVRWLGARPDVRLPIGVSFFTFQAMSAVIDVYRRQARVSRNPLEFGLYIAFFPQLIAGPIVRYQDIAAQLAARRESLAEFSYGARRFVLGLAKKALIANPVSRIADGGFGWPADELSGPAAWLALWAFGVQIYFDFSGYSDMAIGLGHMFGFHFRENFDHPYAARSVTEFWRRWHISLSTWFRDYLYIPLGGSRFGRLRTARNLLVVFFLCGLWHGASWNFVVWGMAHGLLLVLERGGLRDRLERAPRWLGHAWVLASVTLVWLPFRADDWPATRHFAAALFGWDAPAALVRGARSLLDGESALALAVGTLAAFPLRSALERAFGRLRAQAPSWAVWTLDAATAAAFALLFGVSAVWISSSTFNPFLYFRF